MFPLTLGMVPRVPLALGLSGLIPFVVTGVGARFMSPDVSAWMQSTQRAYGACILSFMGAVHWGLEMASYGGTLSTRAHHTRPISRTVRSVGGAIAPVLCVADVRQSPDGNLDATGWI